MNNTSHHSINSIRDLSLSLPFSHRLSEREQFVRFFNHAQVLRTSQCVVFRIPNDLGHFRLGITLKAKGRAVDRNQTRRQIREAMRQLAPQLGSFDYNVVISKARNLGGLSAVRLGQSLLHELPNALQKQ